MNDRVDENRFWSMMTRDLFTGPGLIGGCRLWISNLELFLTGSIIVFGLVYALVSVRRAFNFDEFQVLYTGAALLRGKAIYTDQVGNHFPLFNLFMSFLIYLTGFQTAVVPLARFCVLATDVLILYFVFKIGDHLWSRTTGLAAVALSLSCLVFLEKGLEIRHDVFNTLFQVIGAYYVLCYLRSRKTNHLLISAIAFGLALASTQKGIVMSSGLVLGLLFFCIRKGSVARAVKASLAYVMVIPVPLILLISLLFITTDENLSRLVQTSVINVLRSFIAGKDILYPFPYSRFEQFGHLIFQNSFYYAIGIGGIASIAIQWWKEGTEKVVIGAGALIGVLFYLTARRPFYQTLLPVIPFLSLTGAGFIMEIWGGLTGSTSRRIGVAVVSGFLLLAWPACLIFPQMEWDPKRKSQLENVSFALENLGPGDKVLCFTQNQIFFDPVLRMTDNECGERIYDYSPACLEKRMRESQCKLIIYDYRTQLLNQKVKKAISENYLPIRIGNILVPGFLVGPGKSGRKIWIEGFYRVGNGSVEVNGRTVSGNVYLRAEEYKFINSRSLPVPLVYLFARERGAMESISPLGPGSKARRASFIQGRGSDIGVL